MQKAGFHLLLHLYVGANMHVGDEMQLSQCVFIRHTDWKKKV